MMKLPLAVAAVLALSVAAGAAEFEIDRTHSSVGFKVKHMMVSNVRGQFGEFSGSFVWDPADPGAAKVEAVVQTASVDTGNEKRDEHLRASDFFDAANHATMSFVSTKLESKGENRYALHGDLTLRGVTKPVEFDVEFLGELNDPRAGRRAGFEARATINRQDFGVSFSRPLETGGVVVADEVTIELAVEGVEKTS